MDIIIAAAGQGTRLHEYTKSIPKHIIPIHGRPFLYYLLDAVLEAQFRRIFVVGGHHFVQLAEAMKQYGHEDQITLVNQFDYVASERYGTACPVLACRDLVQGDRFVYTMGDHLLSARDLQQMQQSTRDWLVGVTEHPHPERYGVVEYNADHTVARIVEKPTEPKTHDINVGLYTLSPQIFATVEQLPASARNEYEITDAINAQAMTTPVRAVTLQDYWMDLGRPEDIAALEKFLNV